MECLFYANLLVNSYLLVIFKGIGTNNRFFLKEIDSICDHEYIKFNKLLHMEKLYVTWCLLINQVIFDGGSEAGDMQLAVIISPS